MNIELMLSNAIEFKTAALRCLETKDENLHKSLNFPAIMCFSFSIELYLKYILSKKGIKFKRVHHFGKLMSTLDSNTVNLIIFIIRPYHPDFVNKLKTHSNSFDEWRYKFENHEKGSNIVDYQFLKDFANTLEHIAQSS